MIHIKDLIKDHYDPQWYIIEISLNHLSLALCPFNPKLGDKYDYVIYGEYSGLTMTFVQVQRLIGRWLTKTIQTPENQPIFDHIESIMQEFLHQPNDAATRTAIEQKVFDYWRNVVPYDIQFLDADTAMVILGLRTIT